MEGTMPAPSASKCIQVAHIYGNFSKETRQTISAMVSAVLQGHCACGRLGVAPGLTKGWEAITRLNESAKKRRQNKEANRIIQKKHIVMYILYLYVYIYINLMIYK